MRTSVCKLFTGPDSPIIKAFCLDYQHKLPRVENAKPGQNYGSVSLFHLKTTACWRKTSRLSDSLLRTFILPVPRDQKTLDSKDTHSNLSIVGNITLLSPTRNI